MNRNFNDRLKNSHILRLSAFFLLLLFYAMPVADFMTVVSREYGYSFLERISLTYRAFIICLLFVICSAFITKKKIIIIIPFLSSLSFLLINYISLGANDRILAESILLLFKFFIFFLFFEGFRSVIKERLVNELSLYRGVSVLILAYVVAIIIGAFFQIESFQYYENGRWGVKGIVISGNEASAFLLAALTWFLLNKKNIVNAICVFMVIAAMLLSGTKASIIGMFLLVLGALWAKNGIRFIYSGTVTLIIFLFFSFVLYRFNSNIALAVDNTIAYFEYQYYHHANGSFITLALSGRDIKLDKVYSLIFEYSIWSLLFGGYPVAGYTVEMDIFDIIALMGLLGAIIYFWYWFSCWKNASEKLDYYHSRLKLVFLGTFLSLAFLGGHMFYSAIASPFLALLAIRFSKSIMACK